jgi:hypothetical protein
VTPENYGGEVTTNDSWRRYLEAGTAVGQATVARAEELAKSLFADDDDEREHAWRDLDDLARFGRIVGEQLAGLARAEINRQLRTVAIGSFERFFERVTDLLGTERPAESAEPAPAVVEASVTVTTVGPDLAPGDRAKKHKKNKDKSEHKKHKAKDKGKAKSKKDKSATNGSDAHRSGNGHPATERRRVLTLATPFDSATRP